MNHNIVLYCILSFSAKIVSVNLVEYVHTIDDTTLKLACPLYAQNGDLIWRGPPNLSPYSINDNINAPLTMNDRIKIQQTNQTGQYDLLLQNITKGDEGVYQCETLQGDIGVRHQFSVFVEAVLVDIWPTVVQCNISSSVRLQCRIRKGSVNVTNHRWIHSYNGQVIRQLKGEVFENTSTLVLHFCGFKDSGTYTCAWSIQSEERFSSKALMTVFSQPLVASKKLSNDDNYLNLEVVVYGYPVPTHADWFYSSEFVIAQQERNETFFLNLPFHNQITKVRGFKTSFVAKYTTEYSVGVFNCQIINSYGSVDVWFDQEYITQYFRKTIVKESEILTLGIYIVIGSLVCSTVFAVLCATTWILYKRKAMHRGRNLPRVPQQHLVTDIHGVPGNSTAITSDGGHEYEEILDIQLPNNTDHTQISQDESDTSDPDTEQNTRDTYVTAANTYEDLDSENKTIHVYAEPSSN